MSPPPHRPPSNKLTVGHRAQGKVFRFKNYSCFQISEIQPDKIITPLIFTNEELAQIKLL